MVTIIDYGMGNLGSLLNMFRYLRVNAIATSDIEEIKQAKRLIMPGVGAFDSAMSAINNQPRLRLALEDKILGEMVPVLGICLGMQILTCGSEEGNMPGLGWIKGCAKRFPKMEGLKVPHMGWSDAEKLCNSTSLLKGINQRSRYYFVHSYFVKTEDRAHALMETEHGLRFDSAIVNGNIFGVQFHPEKSQKHGMKVLENFSRVNIQ